jgi:hypothetical protein
MRISILLLFLLLTMDFASALGNHSENASRQRGSIVEELNQKAIHNLYNNGDFEPVIDVLERFQKNHETYSFSDSVFIAKHLAVVYTASPETREKGRYFMMRLLELVPTAKLVDMFVSDEIDRIFEKVREEFLAKQHGFGLDSLTVMLRHEPEGDPDPRTEREKQLTNSSGGRAKYWWIGGATIIAIGATSYVLWMNNQNNTEPRELVVRNPDASK